MDPKFMRDICRAKKHKQGLKKMQANNARAVSVHAAALKVLGKPEEVKSKIPKVISYTFS